MRDQEADRCCKYADDFLHNVFDDSGVDERVLVQDANVIIIFDRIKYSSDIIVFYVIGQMVECSVNNQFIVNIQAREAAGLF